MGFSIGPGIDKSKKSENTNLTDNSNRLATEGSSIFEVGAGGQLNLLDGGAVESVFEFANNLTSRSLDLLGANIEGERAGLANVLEKTSEDSGERIARMIKWTAGAGFALGAVYIIFGRKK